VRHRFLCPLRWADLDMLGHVNNVRYVDYLQEARGAMLRACLDEAGVPRHHGEGIVVVRHEVNFVMPLMFSHEPVVVETWVSDLRTAQFTLDHEIFHEQPDGTRTVYLRARTVLAPYVHTEGMPRRLSPEERNALAPYAAEAGARSQPVLTEVPRQADRYFPVHVRFSDIDVYRHVNNVQYFEFFQEARIALIGNLHDAIRDYPRMHVVVARSDIDYVASMVLRSEPYDCFTTISRIGNKSMTVDSEILDSTGGAGDGQVLARNRVTLVFFDVESQRSVSPPAGLREAILGALGTS
jgi:acyl-CoA thioester hydrolase